MQVAFAVARPPAAHNRAGRRRRATARRAPPAPAAPGAGACRTASTRLTGAARPARRAPRPARRRPAGAPGSGAGGTGGNRPTTCSLRDRPVCRRRPVSPIRVDQLALDEGVDIFIGRRRSRSAGSDRTARRSDSSPRGDARAHRRETARRPCASASAHAWLPVMSSSNSRRSTGSDFAEIEDVRVRFAGETSGPQGAHASCFRAAAPLVDALRSGDGRPHHAALALCSLRRTTPVTVSCNLPTTASRAARAGVNHSRLESDRRTSRPSAPSIPARG